MADLIERSEIVKVAKKSFDAWNLAMATADGQREVNLCFKRQELCKAVKAVAKACPAVDAEPVVHAEWTEPFPYTNGAICSQCETHSARRSKYCPECGAKMDGSDG